MASLSGEFNFQQFTDAGAPLASGRVYTYTAGTTTKKTAYTDAAASVAHTYTSDGAGGEYIALNSRGELPAPLFLTSGAYDILLKRSDGTTVWTRRACPVDDAHQFVSTSDYDDDIVTALAAAAGKTLLIDSAVVVGADLTIPASIGVHVVKPGGITTNSGRTLTISGSFEAGAFQVFSGAGTVVFGASSRCPSPKIWFGTGDDGAVYNTRRTLLQSASAVGGPVHAFEDDNTLNFTSVMAANANAYASYDANTTIGGAGHYDHHVSFQARPTYSGSGSIWSRWDGFNWLVTHSGSGTASTVRGFHAENPLGSGTINFLAGFLCEYLNRGAETHGFFSATPLNTVRTSAGQFAQWRLQGNGQTGGDGFYLSSQADSSAIIWQGSNFGIQFGTNNTSRGALTAAGLWKMSDAGFSDVLSSNQRLEVAGTGAATFKATGAATVGCVLNWHAATTGDNLFTGFYEGAGPTLRGSIDYNRAGGLTRYNTTSDASLKNIIGDAEAASSVAILESTRIREYAWKEDAAQKRQIGVIAQELHGTFKGAVSIGGEYEEIVDGDAVKRYRPWAVDKTAFTFHLIAGFQHQQREIAALKADIAALKAAR